MKKILSLFFIFSMYAFSQTVRPFVGCSAYLDTDFEESSFANFSAGIECKLAYFLKPEIEINIMVGTLDLVVDANNQGIILSEYSKKIFSLNYVFCPKIILANKETESYSAYFQILPKITYSNIEATGHSLSWDSKNISKPIEGTETKLDTQLSFGIGIGLVVNFSNQNSDSMDINIFFNNIDYGNSLNMLTKSQTYKTDDVLGLGINYYFSFKKKNSKK